MGRALMIACTSVGLGIVFGIMIAVASASPVASVALPPAGFSDELLHCAADVDTSQWTTFRSKTFTFELKFPQSFTMRDREDRLELRPVTGEFPIITFWKERSTVAEAMNGAPYQFAGYKVQDRQNLVMATPYFSEDADTITSTYLFIRDFQVNGYGSPLTVIRASIRDEALNAMLMQARGEGIVDIESVLTPAEQILSTFRFLSNSELYGPAGYRAS